jgi:hypothetical protein
MATKPDVKPEAKPAPAAKKSGGKLKFLTGMVVFACAVPFLMPTVTLLLIGMIPTLVALMTDNDRQKSSAAAVASMNFAGITPFIIDLWMKGQSMENVFQILRESSTWLVILGAAFVGHLIVFAIPQAMASLTVARSEARLKILKQNLEQLKSTWGPDVATTKPLNRGGPN